MSYTNKTQEFLTKLETVCDILYSRGDEKKALENIGKSDLLLMEELLQRCHAIMRKTLIDRAVD